MLRKSIAPRARLLLADSGSVAGRPLRIACRAKPIGIASAAILAAWQSAGPVGLAMCGAAWVLAPQFRKRRRSAALSREIERHLPLVLERLVVAVQSGLDILPALNALTRPEGLEPPADPVSAALGSILLRVERGADADDSIRLAAHSCESLALRHALLHLAQARSHGGELSGPLRELSDATQLSSEELAEERIARMPAQAMLPLGLVFSGLLILLLTVPLLQVAQMGERDLSRSAGHEK